MEFQLFDGLFLVIECTGPDRGEDTVIPNVVISILDTMKKFN